MESDSESQDSDDGRRFRFETTRKDGQSRRQATPDRDNGGRRRSRDRSLRDERQSSRRGRSSPEDRRDRRGYRPKESREQQQQQQQQQRHESRNGREHRHKSKRDKHNKRRSREKSPEEGKKEERESTPAQSASSRTSSPAVVPAAELQPERNSRQGKLEEEVNEARPESAGSSATSNPGPPVVSDAMPAGPRPSIIGPGLPPRHAPPPPPPATAARKKPLSFFDRVVHRATRDPDDGLYGPALPPKLEKRAFEEAATSASSRAIGPTLPPALDKPVSPVEQQEQPEDKEEDVHMGEATPDEKEEDEEEEEAFGPALPPNLQRPKILGPMLPENFVVPDVDAAEKITEELADEAQEDEEEEDDNVVGPLPADHPANKSSHVQMQLEYRARRVKEKFRDKTSPEKSKREEWMVELPPAHAVALGLGSIPRKFKTREGPDMSDRSMWTDTPADRLRKQREKEENRFVPSQEKSKKEKPSVQEVPEAEDEPESLLDMHLKSMKKKKKKMDKEAKELGLPTRRPFDRDVDLQVNRLDDAKKKKIFDKARFLNDRFAPGKI